MHDLLERPLDRPSSRGQWRCTPRPSPSRPAPNQLEAHRVDRLSPRPPGLAEHTLLGRRPLRQRAESLDSARPPGVTEADGVGVLEYPPQWLATQGARPRTPIWHARSGLRAACDAPTSLRPAAPARYTRAQEELVAPAEVGLPFRGPVCRM